MSHPDRSVRLNRLLLGLVGILLLLAGVAGLLVSLRLLPPGLSAVDSSAALVRRGVGVQWWVPYATVVLTVLLAVGFLRWLLAQLPRARTRTWRLPTDRPGQGRTYLDAQTAADAIVADLRGYPGVTTASATLTGHLLGPTLHLEVCTDARIPLDPLRARIADHALPRLRHALQIVSLPTNLVLRLDNATTRTLVR